MKIWKWIKFSMHIILAVLVVVLREFFVLEGVLKYFIGGLICFYSISALIPLICFKDKCYEHNDFYHGCIELILGICTILFFETYETICIIWAVWAILREAHEFQELLLEEKVQTVKWLSIIESTVAIVLSIMLIIEPGEHHAMTHMILLCIELATTVLFPLIAEAFEKKYYNEETE